MKCIIASPDDTHGTCSGLQVTQPLLGTVAGTQGRHGVIYDVIYGVSYDVSYGVS